jgi:signal transduction histidine kinase
VVARALSIKLPQNGPEADRRIGPLCRLIFNFRLIVLVITLGSLPQQQGELAPLVLALIVATFASFIPLKFWNRLGPTLVRHPAFLAVDLLLTMMILTVTGPDSPFFYFTLGTALLSGVLYGWPGAVVFSVMLLACYWLGYSVRESLGASAPGYYQTLIGFPALYPICAAAGAGVRRLIDRQSEAEARLAAASRTTAIERERARIAREMHDSLAKSIHGIGLQAAALTRWIERDPRRAVSDARSISTAASTAAHQARELIKDLRSDSLDDSLGSAARAYVEQWSDSSGIPVLVDAREVACPCPELRWELLSILKEALHNVELHAEADEVRVALEERDEDVVLAIADDGVGSEGIGNVRNLGRNGHFGLVGMYERAERVGGRLVVESSPGLGTTVTAVAPLAGRSEGGSL